MNSKLHKIYSSKVILTFVFLAIFIIMLYCNFLTPLAGDDYLYMYGADWNRIESVWDIFPSMAAHRYTTNGRIIPHFFVQLFLLLPLPIFKALNSAVFTFFIYLIYYYALNFSSVGKNSCNVLLLCTIFGVVWVISPTFATIYLWLDGSINYLWCEVLVLLWLIPFVKRFIYGYELTTYQEILFCLFSFVIGNYSENSSVSSIFISFLFIALTFLYRKQKPSRWQITAFSFAVFGLLVLTFTPSELTTKVSISSAIVLYDRFIAYFKNFLGYWPLLVFLGTSLIISYKENFPQAERILSLVLFAGALASQFVLIFSAYFSERSTYITFMYLTVACAINYSSLSKTKFSLFLCLLRSICLLLTIYWGYIGSCDLRTVDYRYRSNDQLIRSEAAAGTKKVQVPYIIPDTEYSVFYLWFYIDLDPTHYINTTMAKYYGIDELSGYFLYD